MNALLDNDLLEGTFQESRLTLLRFLFFCSSLSLSLPLSLSVSVSVSLCLSHCLSVFFPPSLSFPSLPSLSSLCFLYCCLLTLPSALSPFYSQGCHGGGTTVPSHCSCERVEYYRSPSHSPAQEPLVSLPCILLLWKPYYGRLCGNTRQPN